METQDEHNAVVLDSLARLMAGYGATRQFMTVLIASHPDPLRLQAAWNGRRDGWVDEEMAQPFFGIPTYQEAYVDALGSLSQEVDRAASAV